MNFNSWTNPEVITAICIGIGTIIGAIATFISKLKGKNFKEILSGQNKEQLETIKTAFHDLTEVAKKEAEIIKAAIDKQKEAEIKKE